RKSESQDRAALMPQQRRSIAQSRCNSSEQACLNSHFMRIGLFANKPAGKSHELRRTVSIVTDLLSRGIELKRGSPMAMLAKKAPNPTDKHVGSRVRMRRMMLGMSQEKLGDALSLTFQQVQKYEKGANRIGASRLQQISNILQVPVSFF